MNATKRKCFFCGKLITGKAQKHHIRPKRLYRKGEDHKRHNLAPCHPECHLTWHREHDNPRLKRWQWEREFERIDFGEGIFAE